MIELNNIAKDRKHPEHDRAKELLKLGNEIWKRTVKDKSAKKIAEELDMNPNTVYRYMKALGIPTRSRASSKKELSSKEREKLQELIGSGISEQTARTRILMNRTKQVEQRRLYRQSRERTEEDTKRDRKRKREQRGMSEKINAFADEFVLQIKKGLLPQAAVKQAALSLRRNKEITLHPGPKKEAIQKAIKEKKVPFIAIDTLDLRQPVDWAKYRKKRKKS